MRNSAGFTLVSWLLAAIPTFGGDALKVKIVDRQDHENRYAYFVPGYSTADSNTNVNCFGTDVSSNCSGSTHVTGTTVPPRYGSFDVRGATFSLLLPDGRIAVVNCEGKFKQGFHTDIWSAADPRLNRRSCRAPLVDDVVAEFNGDNAKLKWPVSLDGKKIESETYKILGVLDKKP
jgi:hypothetical protein